MKNYNALLLITFFSLIFTLSSCSEDENPADSFEGRQEVNFTYNGKSGTYFGGEFYDATGESNSSITRIDLIDISKKFEFAIEDTDLFDRFSFTFSNSFGLVGLPTGEIIENPHFFAYVFKLPNDGDTISGAGFGSNNYEDTNIENVSLIFNEVFSNGVEKVIDGVREDYPKERLVGTLNLQLKNSLGESEFIIMDFDLEGDNIIKERDNNISTQTGSGGSGSSALLGKWNQVSVCSNSSGEKNNFNFSSSSSGTVFQSDCNSTCSGGGVTTNFNYTILGNNVTITPTRVSAYCGVEANVPTAFTSSWSISGNTLTLDGQDFTKN